MTHVDDTELSAHWDSGLSPGEKSNCMVQLCDGIVPDVTFCIVILVSTVPWNVAGSAVVLTVVPDTAVQLRDTLSPGRALNCLAGACQSYVILHVRVALSPLTTG